MGTGNKKVVNDYKHMPKKAVSGENLYLVKNQTVK